MRKILSAVILLLAVPMIAGGGFEIEGRMGQSNAFLAISLSVGAQLMAMLAGFVASPKPGKIGVVRGIAFTLYLVQSLSFSVVIVELLYNEYARSESSNSNQLIWIFVQGCAAVILLVIS